jgi:uncharacterized protein DUF6542
MTTSAHGAAGPWGGDAWTTESYPADGRLASTVDDYDLLAQEAPTAAWAEVDEGAPDDWGPQDAVLPADSWDRGEQVYESAAEGLTSRGLVSLTALAAGACALLDLGLTGGRLTFFFDLCFVVICLVAAMAVRRDDLFTAGVLPPLLFAAVIAVLSVAVPHAFDSAPGITKVFLSGLASHAPGLVGGYAVALLAVAARMTASEPGPRS